MTDTPLGGDIARVVAWPLLAVPGLATPVFQPPLMIHVVPFIVGPPSSARNRGTRQPRASAKRMAVSSSAAFVGDRPVIRS